MKDKSIIIIGAGIAGLSAGCYGQMNGYKTTIFEMHDKPGGLCTSWQRKNYIFDGCIHHLAGASPASRYYSVWEELGTSGIEMAFHDLFVRCEDPDGKQFNVYTDIDRLEEHLQELAPGDARLINEFISAVRRFTRFELLALPLYKPAEMFRLAPGLASLPRWMKVTLDNFATRFKDPFLRRVFPHIQYDIAGVPMGVHLGFLAGCHNRTLGTPRVDSLTYARAVEERYRQLGGEVHYRSRVERILLDGNKAVGIRLANGEEYPADVVVSAADGRSTIFEMLEGRFIDDNISAYYNSPPAAPQPFAATISLGVGRDLSHEPTAIMYNTGESAYIAGQERSHLNLEIYAGEGFAPAGKSVIMVPLDATYSYFSELHRDKERYKEAKAQDTEKVIELLEKRFPGLSSQVEVKDMATPVTTERYTGNFHGMQPWGPPKGGLKVMMKGLSRTLPGLGNFYMAGHWADAMIGVSTAALSGRNLIRNLCKQQHRPFTHQK